MKKLLLIPFICSTLYAGTVTYESQKITYDDQYSLKGWSGHNFDDKDLNGKVIYASSFYSEEPGTKIFKDDLVATFVKCNLQNIVIPVGVTLIDCQTDWFKSQNDLEDWKIDKDTKEPVEPLQKEKYVELGISTDPKDIPKVKEDQPITEKKRIEKAKQDQVQVLQQEIDKLQAEISASQQPTGEIAQ